MIEVFLSLKFIGTVAPKIRRFENTPISEALIKNIYLVKTDIDPQSLPRIGFSRYREFSKANFLSIYQNDEPGFMDRHVAIFLLTKKLNWIGKVFLPISLPLYLLRAIFCFND